MQTKNPSRNYLQLYPRSWCKVSVLGRMKHTPCVGMEGLGAHVRLYWIVKYKNILMCEYLNSKVIHWKYTNVTSKPININV